jgi:hypothetical protein
MKKFSALILASSIGLAAQAQVVDTLNNTTLAPYTQTTVLQNGASSGITFSDSTGTLTSTGGGTVPDQVLFLRNDYSLYLGETLSVGVAISATGGANSDFGIAIASQVNPIPAVYAGSNVNTRSNFLAVYVKPASGEIGAAGFSGTTQVISSHNTAASFLTINSLWITETAADVFSVGYTTPTSTNTYASGLVFNQGDIGNSIGFYSDMRGTITSPAVLSNLTITPAPEPSTLAMAGMSLFGLFAVVRRKK